MWYDPEQENHLSALLGAVLDQYEIEYQTYWETQLDDARLRLYELGLALGDCIHSLTAQPAALKRLRALLLTLGVSRELELNNAVAAVKDLAKHPVVRDSILIQIGFEAQHEVLSGAEDRAQFLLSLLGTTTLSERAAMFLDRATRLYVWGFGAECVVMCAAVLEAALESRFPPEEMFRLQITKEGREYSIYQYIRAASASGVFDADDRSKADTLRSARNDAIHYAPGLLAMAPPDALATLVALLGKIFPATHD